MKKLLTFFLLTLLTFSVGWAQQTVNDVLNRSVTGITGSAYDSFSGKTGASGAVYAGNCAGGNNSIQLRSTNNNSGIVTTGSGGKARTITVVWNSNTADGRTLNVYGKNSAYSSAANLYDSSNQGTLLGTIVKGTSTLTISGDYAYIGFRSASGAMYLTSVTITWEKSSSCVRPIFSPGAGSYFGTQNVTITCDTQGASIYYTTDGSDPSSSNGTLYSGPLTISSSTTLKAIAVKDGFDDSDIATAEYEILTGRIIYEKVTSLSQLQVGKKYIIVNVNNNRFMGAVDTYGAAVSGPVINTQNNTVDITDYYDDITKLVLGQEQYGYTFYTGTGYLYWGTGDGNSLKLNPTASAGAQWVASINNENCILTNFPTAGYTSPRVIRYNQSTPRFACYESSQQPAVLFVEQTPEPSLSVSTNSLSLDDIPYNGNSTSGTFTLMGAHLSQNVTMSFNGAEGFSITPSSTTITPDGNGSVNQEYTVTYSGSSTSEVTATVTFTCGDLSQTVDVTAKKATPPAATLTATPSSLTINDSGTGNTFAVEGSYLDEDNVGVTQTNNNFDFSLSATTGTTYDYQSGTYRGFTPANGSLTGTVAMSYTGRELSASNTVTLANDQTSATVTVNYLADLYIVTDNGVTDDWHFDGTYGEHMTYNNGVYTATFTANNPYTFIVFARKLGDGVTWNTRYVFGPSSGGDWWLPASGNGNGNIDLNTSHPIRIQDAGTYIVTINANNNTFTITKQNVSSGDFVLVTDASQLNAGDEVIIVNSGISGSARTMGQRNNNNYYGTAVEVTSHHTVAATSATQIFTIEQGTGGWYFRSSDNLYLTSGTSNSNNLNTTTKDYNGQSTSLAAITIGSENVATIQFQGTGGRKDLQYNPNGIATNPSANDIFSCYSGNQDDVYIYRRASSNEPSITVNPANALDLGTIPAGGTQTSATFTVQGFNLNEGDVVTLSVDNQNFTVSPTTISAADAMAGAVTVTVTYAGSDYDANATVTIGSQYGDFETVTLPVTAHREALAVTVTPPSGTTFIGSTISGEISANVAGATIYYSLDGGQTWEVYVDGFTATAPTVNTSATVMAYATYNGETSETVSVTYTRLSVNSSLFTKVTDASQIKDGNKYILVYEDTPEALNGITTSGTGVAVEWETQGSVVNIRNTHPVVFTLNGNINSFSLSFDDNGVTRYLDADNRDLSFATTASLWSADAYQTGYSILKGEKMLQFNTAVNAGNGPFRMYGETNYGPVYLYVQGVALPLSTIEMTEEKGAHVVVSDQLVGAWAIDNGNTKLLWVKDQGNSSIIPTSNDLNAIDYMMDYCRSNPQQYPWDQSNWAVIDFSNQTVSPTLFVNKVIKGMTIEGTYTDDMNYTITLDATAALESIEDAEGYYGYIEGAYGDPKEMQHSDYRYNHYTVVNFLEQNLNEPWGPGAQAGPEARAVDPGTPMFFMNPKIMEVAHVWGVYDGLHDGYQRFDVMENSGSNNGFDLEGALNILSWEYNRKDAESYGVPDGLVEGSAYMFHIVVARENFQYGYHTTPSTQLRDTEGSDTSASMGAYALDLPSGQGGFTAVNDVKVATQVESVRYYNVMGVESEVPFEGVNIMVTRYSDGSVTSRKVLR